MKLVAIIFIIGMVAVISQPIWIDLQYLGCLAYSNTISTNTGECWLKHEITKLERGSW